MFPGCEISVTDVAQALTTERSFRGDSPLGFGTTRRGAPERFPAGLLLGDRLEQHRLELLRDGAPGILQVDLNVTRITTTRVLMRPCRGRGAVRPARIRSARFACVRAAAGRRVDLALRIGRPSGPAPRDLAAAPRCWAGFREATRVGGWRERARPATRGALTPAPPATRGPALRAAGNFPTDSCYGLDLICAWLRRRLRAPGAAASGLGGVRFTCMPRAVRTAK